ncbi:D-alanyl-D-alanine carboxypeptidase/D-alanyl-D-alanine-endopeptidase [candidate division BRC1 bacterium HGW-BRC1-1]|jgi:PBP4 family serine-type D-alanyl-D-alanine carboxypeptidase|nr:MAG: D-alanyl-D-alanine carboxypeptidase/D-alanyl-D-alanine-endopeptidase [candidate division BRC1 bacterium HGW-BRC1-1]
MTLRIFLSLLLAASLGAATPHATAAPSKTKSKTSTKSTTQKKSTSSQSTPKVEPPTSTTIATLPGIMESIIKRVSASSNWGVMVTALDSGKVLYSRNADNRYIPASNRKLFTSAFALDQLGADFQYRTYLYRTGPVDAAGLLKGDLVIRPQGDPTFSDRLIRSAPTDWIYRDWVTKCKSDNIKEIEGSLIVDCSEWDLNNLQPKGWPARMKDDYYAPKTSPLTVNENLLEFKVKPGKDGAAGIIDFVPDAEGYPVTNNTKTGGQGGVNVSRNSTGQLVVSGSPKGTTTYAIPADNPTLYAAAIFRSQLKREGITVRGSIRVVSGKNSVPPPTSENVVAVYISPPMSEIIHLMNKQSNNHFAEQIYVSVPAIKLGMGSYPAAKKLEADFLARAGIKNPQFEDGSGLSEMNRVSPDEMVKLLAMMKNHPASQVYFDSLPVGGRDGTLRNRMQDKDVVARVHAKTGYINRVSCLSGYVLPNEQQSPLAFSFLVNEMRTDVSTVKATQDKLCEALSVLKP